MLLLELQIYRRSTTLQFIPAQYKYYACLFLGMSIFRHVYFKNQISVNLVDRIVLV